MASKVYLFTGVETFHWFMTDFDNVIDFCKQHNIDGIVLKVYEVVQGEWYQGLGGSKAVYDHITASGLDCLPYGYFYGGSDMESEQSALTRLFSIYSRFCLNLEKEWNNNSNGSLQSLVSFLASNPQVEIWVSTWADPVTQGWVQNIQALDPYVKVWMPEEYFDSLIQARIDQFPKVKGSIYPTYCVSQETINLIAITDNPSIWEYQGALRDTAWVDSFIKAVKGGNMLPPPGGTMSLVLNSDGMVLDVPFSYQIEIGESQDLCGNYGVATLAYSGPPNQGAKGSSEDVDVMADMLASKWNAGPVNEQGSSIQDMFNYLTVTDKNGQRLLHYQEIPADSASIKAAVQAGYPVLVTVNEQNVRSTKTGQRPPYPWNLNVNHIFPIMGIDNTGNYIVADYLNNRFQNEWPCHYDASVLQPSWACAIQVVGPDASKPWLATIPSATPTTWQQGFNAQLFANSGTTQPPVSPPSTTNSRQKQANDIWNYTKVVGGTDIFKAWFTIVTTTNSDLGIPLGGEVATVDWAGNSVQYQSFSAGFHIEFSKLDSHCRVYDSTNKMVYDVLHGVIQ